MVRYFVTDDVSQWEVDPVNDNELSIEWRKDREYYYYRRELIGTVKLQKGLFWDDLIDFEGDGVCKRFCLIIEKFCGGQWEEDWRGEFSITDCEFDKDICTVEFQPTADDVLTDIVKEYDIKYNVLEVLTLFPTWLHVINQNTGGTLSLLYERGRLLSDIMDFWANKYGLTYSSGFFISADPIGGVDLSNVTMNHKSDVKDPTASNPATEAMVSFGEMMEMLHNTWNLYFHVDNGVLYVEHEQYYENGLSYGGFPVVGLDLTLPEYKVKNMNKYKYIGVEMPTIERWEYQEGEIINKFWGEVKYDVDCTTGEKVDRKVNLAIADIWRIWRFFADYSDDGFVLLQNVQNTFGTGYMVFGYDVGANINLTWERLIQNYWKWNRVLVDGIINNSIHITFDSMKRIKEGEVIRTRLCCEELEPLKLVKTTLGNGRVQTAKRRLKDDRIEITLRYE